MESAKKENYKQETIALEIKHVSKSFRSETGKSIKALENINLTVNKGDFATLLGITGCGKTTLLNLVSGLDTPQKGAIKLSQDLRFGENIAYVFQHYTLLPWRSVLKNVTFGLQMRSVPRNVRKNKAYKLLAKVGLTGFEDAYPYELSGGMRQRAAIAQALAIEPDLLLMDEPFGALDNTTRTELQQMLIDLWLENHMTVLFVTHNIDEAIVLGNRILIFSQRPGRISHEFKVDLPRPRDKISTEFTNFFIKVRKALSGQLD